MKSKQNSSNIQTKKVEAKTKKGKHFLEARAPQVVEDIKKLLLLYGKRTSQKIKDILVDLKHLRDSTECVHLTRKNANVLPFESGGETSLEFLANKADCGAFIVGSSSKKRPENLILGRMYDEKVYDLLELGVKQYSRGLLSKSVFSPKPCFTFSGTIAGYFKELDFHFGTYFSGAGDEFETVPEFRHFKNFIVDAFRGRVVDSLNLKGVDRVIACIPSSSSSKGVLLRHYAIKLKRSGTKIPRVELEDIGPSFDFEFRRVREAPVELAKEAIKRVDEGQRRKKVKNVSDDILDGTVGRIWLKKQDIDQMPLRKPKGKNRGTKDAQ